MTLSIHFIKNNFTIIKEYAKPVVTNLNLSIFQQLGNEKAFPAEKTFSTEKLFSYWETFFLMRNYSAFLVGYFSEIGFTSYSCKLCSNYSSKNAQYICYSFNLSCLQSNFSTIKIFSGFEGLLYGFIYKSRGITLLFWKKDTYSMTLIAAPFTTQKYDFPITVSVIGTKSTADLIAFIEELFNGKINFLGSHFCIIFHIISLNLNMQLDETCFIKVFNSFIAVIKLNTNKSFLNNVYHFFHQMFINICNITNINSFVYNQ